MQNVILQMEKELHAKLAIELKQLQDHQSAQFQQIFNLIQQQQGPASASPSPQAAPPASQPPAPASPKSRHSSEPFSIMSISQPARLKPSDFPKFQGSDEQDIDTWISHVSSIFKHSQHPEPQFLALLPMLLQGQALDWFTSLGDQADHFTTWSHWQQALKEAFRGPNYLENLQTKLFTRKLQADEPVSQYFRDKLSLLNRCFGNSVPNSFKSSEIISGLPFTYQSLVKAARGQHSSDQSLETLRRLLIDLEDGAKQFMQQEDSFAEEEHSDDEDHLQQYQEQQSPSFSPRQPLPSQAKAYKDSFKDISQVTCFKCNDKGHYANACPLLPPKQAVHSQ